MKVLLSDGLVLVNGLYLVDQVDCILQEFNRSFFLIVRVRIFDKLQNLFLRCFAEQNLKRSDKTLIVYSSHLYLYNALYNKDMQNVVRSVFKIHNKTLLLNVWFNKNIKGFMLKLCKLTVPCPLASK